jgi:hypothetical protein
MIGSLREAYNTDLGETIRYETRKKVVGKTIKTGRGQRCLNVNSTTISKDV